MLSKSFVQRWKACQLCDLHKNARHHVIGYGNTPADVLLMGEAPGRTEDILSRPFVGKAGGLLKSIIRDVSYLEQFPYESWQEILVRLPYSIYITNVVACIPWTDDSRSTWREPNAKEADACSPRLQGIIEAAKPKTIIYLGKVAKRFHKAPKGIPTLQVDHPSSILRLNVPPSSSVTYAQVVDRIREQLKSVGVKPC